ncbi:hypothetical protein [Dyadobacter sandarakinus]|uniref:Uncharacterized protein n=1 Tax=Dyadobacter sandarakinus TaxID=2747268 RepID=A0ABX7I5U4_9BACT|nr:hypothetical protein [Dyadobacter sandarakinus]QRR01472.1 hypothetical protein HWI92_11435 [Dyadobacter sandarakinus]
MHSIFKAAFLILLVSLFALSCSKENIDEDCGCGGSTSQVLENRKARYIGEGTFFVPDTLTGGLSVHACDVDASWEIGKDENTWNYTISGNIKSTCLGPNPELRLRAPGGPIQITSIKEM